MAEWFETIPPKLREFIEAQFVFFVATAPERGRINLSPKGMDTFRVLDEGRVAYLDITGSGNETAAHLRQNGRVTVMFCSFSETAKIARLYGHGRVIGQSEPDYAALRRLFPPMTGERQIIEIAVAAAMTSCGYGVPRMERASERETLRSYWEKKDQKGVEDHWERKNLLSIDGLPTGIEHELRQRSKT